MKAKSDFYVNCHRLPAITLYLNQQNRKCLHYRNWQYTEFHISNFWISWSLEGEA